MHITNLLLIYFINCLYPHPNTGRFHDLDPDPVKMYRYLDPQNGLNEDFLCQHFFMCLSLKTLFCWLADLLVSHHGFLASDFVVT